MWADHPAKQLESEFESKVETPISAPEEAKVDDALGWSEDGKSRRLQGKYLCSLGEKQVSPAVYQGLVQQRLS